ncbi:D-glycero-D-manno-heptose 1,7-bisphosphate phosphatase [Candidatus Planktophila dulcis]|nr:D-glycero-D-manno-heptose 1,7-bisphosphate phosphatase [Candidatus Planktophila dulcis]
MIEKYYFSAREVTFKKLVIFDRDDTLIRDVPNLKSVSDINWLPGRLGILKALSEQSTLIAIATNQSAIGRGLLSVEEFESISEAIRRQLKENGISLWGLVACPHMPFENCGCRKPKPGLLNRLVEVAQRSDLEIFFVGNADSDMEAAKASRFQISGVKIEPTSLNGFENILNSRAEAKGK